jgi:hypothetical protein
MIGFRLKPADGLLSIPIALNPETMLIQASAAVAVAEMILIIILKRLLVHVALLSTPKADHFG